MRKILLASILLFITFIQAHASEGILKSYHFGLMHPSGVDLIGYTIEKKTFDKLYNYYTFGFPSIAAMGFNYYTKYQGNGLTGTLGVGIVSVLYGAIGYQLQIERAGCLKVGVGYTTSIVYSGIYPVLAYEIRF